MTKWHGACDKRLATQISHNHHTENNRQYCHVGNEASKCKFMLAGDLKDSNSTGFFACSDENVF